MKFLINSFWIIWSILGLLVLPCMAEREEKSFTNFAVLHARLAISKETGGIRPKDIDLEKYLLSKGFELNDLLSISIGKVGESSIFVVTNENRLFYGFPCDKLVSLLASYNKDGFRFESMVLHRLKMKEGLSILRNADANHKRLQSINSRPASGKGLPAGEVKPSGEPDPENRARG